MTDNKRWMRWVLVPALAATLTACGGGSTDTAPTQAPGNLAPGSSQGANSEPATGPAPITGPTVAPNPAPITSTMPEYLLARAERGTIMGFPSPQPDELASIFANSRTLAVAMLQGQLGQGNAMVVPPLRYSFLNTVASAARGDTLAEVRRLYPLELGPYAAASETQGVTRQVWAQRGARFLPAFLEATDSFGPYPPLGSWAGGEEIGEWWLDSVLRGELNSLHPELPAAVAGADANTRLLVADALSDRVDWPRAQIFSGVYQTESGVRLTLPMLRLSADVKRLRSTDFVADAVKLGDRWLVAIQPSNGSLKNFGDQGRLEAAMADAVRALTTPTTVAVSEGEIVLPVLDAKLSGSAINGTGLMLAYDEINADLRGLDGGGTHLKAADVSTHVAIGADGLALQAAQVATFVYSPKNVFGANYGVIVTLASTDSTFTSWPLPACPSTTPDLRSFFLVVLDEQKRVMSLAAIAGLNGGECQ
jgi:hypothetical protein